MVWTRHDEERALARDYGSRRLDLARPVCPHASVPRGLKRDSAPARHGFGSDPSTSPGDDVESYQRYRFWEWLHAVADSRPGRRPVDGLSF